MIAVKTADGTEQTFHLTDRAAKDTGKDVAEGVDKSAKLRSTTRKRPA